MKLPSIAVVLLLASTAAAQQRTMDPEDAVAPISVVEGAGVKVGEGTVLHPVFGIETGVVSNVFYEEADPNASGLVRLLGEFGVGSLTPQRLGAATDPAGGGPIERSRGSAQYRLDARISYDFYPSDSAAVRSAGGLGMGLLFRGIVRPQAALRFGYFENFQRVIRAANFESRTDTNRDINHLRLQAVYAPRGRSLAGILYYENTIDVFEAPTQRFANRFQNLLGLRVNWRWLPVTRVFADVNWGVFTGLGSSSTKTTSFPLRATAGVQTAITVKSAVSAHIGYGKGFYTDGPDFSNVLGGLNYAYRYSPLGRFQARYEYNFQDSINANYYRDHAVAVGLRQAFVPFVLDVEAEARFRHYDGVTIVMGPPTRDDLILSVVAGLHYNYRDWLAFGLDYRFASIASDYMYVTPDGYPDDPSFVRHELLFGMRAAL
jgi:hypothetical protein